ncbi:NAD(P)-dependent oxidoreductase [Niallia oryzisoli]|uniref:NAD(P)-dependent oxidoreductase n=1 Tax=Niallia oryzisoli TaxID=1737571 RepID=A0ABZ2CI99_9BACI
MSYELGFVGLGNLGGELAGRLIDCGFKVNLYDIDTEKVNALEERGGIGAQSIVELTQKSDVVLTSLPNPKVVDNVYFGKDGLLSLLAPGKCVIELSTIDIQTMKKIAEQGKERNINIIDAPVSAGIPEARAGAAVLLVGAEENVLERYREVLEALAGDKIFHVGLPGDGKAIKLINNLMSLGSVLIGAEAYLIGVQSGIEPKRLYDVLSQCAGRSFQFVKRFPNWVERDFEAGFSIDLGTKDLKLVLDMANQLNRETPLAKHIFSYFEEAQKDGLGKLDVLAVTETVEKLAKKQGMSLT